MKKKLLSILLSVFMIFVIMPITIFADQPDISTWAKLQEAIDASPGTSDSPAASPTSFVLTNDLVATDGDKCLYISEGKNIDIDLNGYTIDRGLKGKTPTSFEGSVIILKSKSILTIRDNSGAKTGKITGGSSNDSGGGIANYQGGTFNLYGGSIEGNYTSGNGGGGGVHVSNGSTFNMNGGKITKNSAMNSGGGVHVYAGGTFNLYDGLISENTAAFCGGVCAVGYGNKAVINMFGGTIDSNASTNHSYAGGLNGNDLSTISITGGKITNNNAPLYGGLYSEDSLIIGGSVEITGNTSGSGSSSKTNNLYLQSGKTITLGTGEQKPTSDMKVGITTETVPTASNPIKITTNGTTDDASYFVSDNENYIINFNAGTDAAGDEYLELKTITIADILPKGFPTIKDNGWVKNLIPIDTFVYKDATNGNLHFDQGPSTITFDFALNEVLTLDNGNYFCSKDGKMIVFTMDDGNLVNIMFYGEERLNGTYTAPVTIADILPDDFPKTKGLAWVNENGARARWNNPYLDIYATGIFGPPLGYKVIKEEDNYKCVQYDDGGNINAIYEFVMNNNALEEIVVSGSKYDGGVYAGTYSPYRYIYAPTSITVGYASDLEFVTNGKYEDQSTTPVSVKLDGALLEYGTNFDVVAGSTRVKLKGSFVSTLPIGTHTVAIGVSGTNYREYSEISKEFIITAVPSPTPTPKPEYVVPNTGIK